MKKIIIAIIGILFLTSCFNSTDTTTVNQARNELLHPTATSSLVPKQVRRDEPTSSGALLKPTQAKKIDIEYLDEKAYITLDPLSEASINTEEMVISWKTQSGWIDKIVVQFSNSDSQYPQDSYTLKTYKRGDTSFKYIASSRQKVLDFWKNVYTFTAYTGKDTSQVKVSIQLDPSSPTLPLPKVERWSTLNSQTGAVIVQQAWPPTLTPNTSISGLNSKNIALEPLDCSKTDAITEFLLTQYTWAYWNTCRDIVKERGISFNVLRLEGDNYMYEKHYYDFTNGNYSVLTLETGIWVTKETMGNKNKELKNKDFSSQTKAADEYFKKMLQISQ